MVCLSFYSPQRGPDDPANPRAQPAREALAADRPWQRLTALSINEQAPAQSRLAD